MWDTMYLTVPDGRKHTGVIALADAGDVIYRSEVGFLMSVLDSCNLKHSSFVDVQ